jgi:hypothetical protein
LSKNKRVNNTKTHIAFNLTILTLTVELRLTTKTKIYDLLLKLKFTIYYIYKDWTNIFFLTLKIWEDKHLYYILFGKAVTLLPIVLKNSNPIYLLVFYIY